MLNLNENFIRCCNETTQELRLLVELSDGLDTWKALNGNCDQLDYAESVVEVSPISREYQDIQSIAQSATIYVTVDDAWLRPIFTNNRLFGKRINIYIGFASLAESDFEPYLLNGVIKSIKPDKGTHVVFEVGDPLWMLRDVDIYKATPGIHPIDRIGAILQTINGSSDNILDLDSFDSLNPAYADISHFSITNGYVGGVYQIDLEDRIVNSKQSSFGVVSELVSLIPGARLTVTESGIVRLILFDASKNSLDTWTNAEIRNGFQIDSLHDNLKNRVDILLRRELDGLPDIRWLVNDDESQQEIAFMGQLRRVIEHTVSGVSWLNNDGSANVDGGTLRVSCSTPEGFSGMVGSYPGPQPTNAQVSISRPAYILLLQNPGEGRGQELVKAESATVNRFLVEQYTGHHGIDNLPFVPVDIESAYKIILYTDLSRDFGNTDTYTGARYAVDVTIAYYLADYILNRFSKGCPIVKFDTGMEKYAYQVGDLISLIMPEYMDFGHDGLNTSTKWEVVGKSFDPTASPPSIQWTLLYAGMNTPEKTHSFLRAGEYLQGSIINAMRESAFAQSAIMTGLDVTNVTGLVGEVSHGSATLPPIASYLYEDTQHTFTASRDTYVAFNVGAGTLMFHDVSNGDPVPEKDIYEVWLAKVVCDATGITFVDTTLRNYAPIPLSKVESFPAFSAYQSTLQALDKSPSIETLIFQSKLYDYGDNYDLSTGKYTAPTDGIYEFKVAVRMANLPDAAGVALRLYVDSGSGPVEKRKGQPSYNITGGSADTQVTESFSDILMEAGDIATIGVVHTGDNPNDTVTGETNTYISGRRVR